ncbi:MAG: hypothetical protein M1837_003216 [Sclerophora amabilis]|nr:MAG: hypothetical protein M1837_003216 [Sclerophora amabilis]
MRADSEPVPPTERHEPTTTAPSQQRSEIPSQSEERASSQRRTSSTSSAARIADLERQNAALEERLMAVLSNMSPQAAERRGDTPQPTDHQGNLRSPINLTRHGQNSTETQEQTLPNTTDQAQGSRTPPERPRSSTATPSIQPVGNLGFKAKPPKPFAGAARDLRAWVVEFEEYLSLTRATEPELQATLAVSLTERSLRRRLTTLRQTDSHNEIFYSWHKLKSWLEENYGPADPHKQASSRMFNLTMRTNQLVQQFINDFETYAAELHWNDDAFSDSFRRKLSATILMQIHAMHPQELSKMLAAWKKAAQRAETHLEVGKRALEEREENPREGKRVRWNDQSTGRGHNFNSRRERPPFRQSSSAANRGPPQLSPDERRRRRDAGECLNCGQTRHWVRNCTNAFSTTPKPKNS